MGNGYKKQILILKDEIRKEKNDQCKIRCKIEKVTTTLDCF